jgi:hypothetical protein
MQILNYQLKNNLVIIRLVFTKNPWDKSQGFLTAEAGNAILFNRQFG